MRSKDRIRVPRKGMSKHAPVDGVLQLQFPNIELVELLKNQCRHFLEYVRTGRRPISSGADGRDVVRVLEAVNRSIECKGLQVEVESKGDYVYADGDAIKSIASAIG